MKTAVLLFFFFTLQAINNIGKAQPGMPIVLDDSLAGTQSLLACDLNRDSLPEILVAGRTGSGHHISYYRNFGSGNFGQRQLISLDIPNPSALQAADFNSDGWKDISAFSTGSADGRLYLFLSDEGVFSESILLDSLLYFAVDMKAVDIDRDMDIDLVLISDTALYVYYNEGGLSFRKVRVPLGVITENYDLILEDINGDAYPEAVVGGTQCNVYGNVNGVLSYDSLASHSIGNQMALVILLHPEDIDNDGDADLILYSSDRKLKSYVNNGLGSFDFHQELEGDIIQCHSMATADLDLDGDKDLLIALPQKGKLAWYENGPGGIFAQRRKIDEGNITETRWILQADFNRDERADVLWADALTLHLNEGFVGFPRIDAQAPFFISPNPTSGMLRISATGDAVLSVFDMTGQEVLRNVDIRKGSGVLHLSLLPQFYFFLFRNGESTYAEKVLIY